MPILLTPHCTMADQERAQEQWRVTRHVGISMWYGCKWRVRKTVERGRFFDIKEAIALKKRLNKADRVKKVPRSGVEGVRWNRKSNGWYVSHWSKGYVTFADVWEAFPVKKRLNETDAAAGVPNARWQMVPCSSTTSGVINTPMCLFLFVARSPSAACPADAPLEVCCALPPL